jgi:hypothetical protein
MRVAIVGAGLSGLAAARELSSQGHEVVVFEKGRAVGGRVATRSEQGFVWDSGATSVALRERSIDRVILEELDRTDLVPVEKPIYLHTGLRVTPGDSRRSGARYCYRSGMQTLAALLAQGLDVRTSTAIERIEPDAGGYRVADERVDAVVLTPPVPQSSLLLWSLGDSRALASARYRACLSIGLGYHAELPAVPYHALLEPEQRHPLTWLSLESVKSSGRAPEGGSSLIAQFSREYSQTNYERPDEALVETAAFYVERLYGKEFAAPAASFVVRWKYSQPESYATFEHVNPLGSRLVVASDGLLGGRIEDAYEVGLRAARQLLS